MSDVNNKKKDEVSPDIFTRQVGVKERRKIKAREDEERGIWFGLGMFGLVGWSVAVPSLIGIAIGVWMDKKFNDAYSWTLMMIFVGVAAGCLNAWYWVKKENNRDRE